MVTKMNKITEGCTVKIVSHGYMDGDVDTHLSNYPGYEIGTEHKVTEISPCGTGIMLDNDISVSPEEVAYVNSPD